jgi:hypothetical protein
MSLNQPDPASERSDHCHGLILIFCGLICSALRVSSAFGQSSNYEVPPTPIEQTPDGESWRPAYQRPPRDAVSSSNTNVTQSGQRKRLSDDRYAAGNPFSNGKRDRSSGVQLANYQQNNRAPSPAAPNASAPSRSTTRPNGSAPTMQSRVIQRDSEVPSFVDDGAEGSADFSGPWISNAPAGYACGQPCCGDPCCGDPCCGQPCCGQPCCGDGVGGGCNNGCGFELSAGYLLWWTKGDQTPPLVTTSPQGTARADAGVLGEDDTSILFGGSSLNNDARSGFYATADYWLSCDRCSGIEATYFFLGEHDDSFNQSSEGDPILARPFFNTDTVEEDSGLIAFPSVQTGSINIRESSELQGGEILWRNNCCRDCRKRVDFLIGARFMRLRDNFRADESETSTDPNGAVPVGTTLELSDEFDTRNTFRGGDVGFITQWHNCAWTCSGTLKLGIGSTESRVSIDGSTTITEPNQTPTTSTGGFLALDSNIGEHHRDFFTMVPEVGASIGYDVSCRLRISAGYNLIYWSKVARPGDQIDRNINPTEFPPATATGTPSPIFRFITNDYWAQGISLAANYRF